MAGILLLVAAVLVLSLVHHRHTRRVREERSKLFDACSGLVEDAIMAKRGLDFPTLEGRWRGDAIRLEPVLDTLSLRTVPVLWLVVTIRRRSNVPGRLSALARVCGTEFYARHQELGEQITDDDLLPRNVSLRLDGWGSAGPGRPLLDRIGAAMADRRVKQMVITPAAARVVWRCATAQSSIYRVTRRVDLDGVRVDVRALEEALDATEDVLRVAERSTAASRNVAR